MTLQFDDGPDLLLIPGSICLQPCLIAGVHTLLRKLQFLFELPARLNKCLELQAYAQAVKSHRHARCVLQQYSHLPSFKGIQDDCHAIMDKLAQELRQKFRWGSKNWQHLMTVFEGCPDSILALNICLISAIISISD